jgi:hypothetical protein
MILCFKRSAGRPEEIASEREKSSCEPIGGAEGNTVWVNAFPSAFHQCQTE